MVQAIVYDVLKTLERNPDAEDPVLFVRALRPEADNERREILEQLDKLFEVAGHVFLPPGTPSLLRDLLFAQDCDEVIERVRRELLVPWTENLAQAYPESFQQAVGRWPERLRLGDEHIRALARGGCLTGDQLLALSPQDSRIDSGSPRMPPELLLVAKLLDRTEEIEGFRLAIESSLSTPTQTSPSDMGDPLARRLSGSEEGEDAGGVSGEPGRLEVSAFDRWRRQAQRQPLLETLFCHDHCGRASRAVFKKPIRQPIVPLDTIVVSLMADPPPADDSQLKWLVECLHELDERDRCLPKKTVLDLAGELEANPNTQIRLELVLICLEACMLKLPCRQDGLRERLESVRKMASAAGRSPSLQGCLGRAIFACCETNHDTAPLTPRETE